MLILARQSYVERNVIYPITIFDAKDAQAEDTQGCSNGPFFMTLRGQEGLKFSRDTANRARVLVLRNASEWPILKGLLKLSFD